MSIEYTLYAASTALEEVVAACLPADPKLAWYTLRPDNAVLTESLGLLPVSAVGFRLDRSADWTEQKLTVLRTTLTTLRDLPGDVALLYQGERVLVVRRQGVLVRNADPELWTQRALAVIDVPCVVERIPTL